MNTVKILQVKVKLLLLATLIASKSDNKANRTPPDDVINAVTHGLELHKKFGGGKNLALAKAIASGEPLTKEQIYGIIDFFKAEEMEEETQDLLHGDQPSPKTIRRFLMGGNAGHKWANYFKMQTELGI